MDVRRTVRRNFGIVVSCVINSIVVCRCATILCFFLVVAQSNTLYSFHLNPFAIIVECAHCRGNILSGPIFSAISGARLRVALRVICKLFQPSAPGARALLARRV